MATVSVRVDDSYRLFVNGTQVLADDYWKDAERRSVEIAPGDVIALAAVNGGGPSGVFVDIAWADGRRVASSEAWQVTTVAPTGDWTAAGFDTSGWRPATAYGAVDDPDFAGGERPAAGSPGQWIWSEGFTTDPETYFRFVVPEPGEPVVARPLADRRVTVGESVAFEVPAGTFDDPDSDAAPRLSAGLVDGGALPDWLGFDGRRFTGTPTAADAGSVEVEVTATDADGGSVADVFELAVDDPTALDPSATLSVRVDDSYQLFVNGTEVLADDYWKDAERRSVEIAPGDVIALAAVNGGGPSGVFVDIAWADGRRVASSEAWQVTTVAPTGDWTAAGFDTSGWRPATAYGAVDDPDFAGGERPAAGSPGQWIWSEGFTTDPETYFRFVVPEPGEPPSSTVPAEATTITFADDDRAKVVDLAAGVFADAARVLPLGDSITLGHEAGKDKEDWDGYRQDLFELAADAGLWFDYVGTRARGPATLLDRDHQGVGGIRASEVAPDAFELATATAPDVVLLKLGTNEALRDADAATTVPPSILSILRDIDAAMPTAHILVSALAPVDPTFERYGSELRDDADALAEAINAALPDTVATARAEGIAVDFVDQPTLTAADLSDGIHPDSGGYAKIAAEWFDALTTTVGTAARTFAGAPKALAADIAHASGTAQGDLLVGDAGANWLDGRGGNDRLIGAGGDDTLTGGAGSDVFVVGDGDDLVTDFTLGMDRLSPAFEPASDDIADFAAHVSVADGGDGALLRFDHAGDSAFTEPDGTVSLRGVDAGELVDLTEVFWL